MGLSCHLKFPSFKYVHSMYLQTLMSIRITKGVWYVCRIQKQELWLGRFGVRLGWCTLISTLHEAEAGDSMFIVREVSAQQVP